MTRYRGMTAPGQGGDPSRFIIMTEVNPWTPQEHAERALLYRGAIVAGWSNVETLAQRMGATRLTR